jgi:hypothetical protein
VCIAPIINIYGINFKVWLSVHALELTCCPVAAWIVQGRTPALKCFPRREAIYAGHCVRALLGLRDADQGGETMTHKRMNEAQIDKSLDAFLHGAQEGDARQARKLHELLDQMLTEREIPDGQLWLTDHGRMLLAEMHRELSHCEGGGHQLSTTVLEAVQLRPHRGHWRDSCSFVHDLRIAIAVANDLCEQRNKGEKPDISKAAQAVADIEETGLNPSAVQEIYDEIAATVGGFREISHC